MRLLQIIVVAICATLPYAQATVAQDKNSLKPKAVASDAAEPSLDRSIGSTRKGGGGVGCVYIVYLTAKETIDACYPRQYPELHEHLAKWLPVMADYWNKNVRDDGQKTDELTGSRGWANYRKSLTPRVCEQTRPFLDKLTSDVAGHPSKADMRMNDLLKQTDKPGRQYGCL